MSNYNGVFMLTALSLLSAPLAQAGAVTVSAGAAAGAMVGNSINAARRKAGIKKAKDKMILFYDIQVISKNDKEAIVEVKDDNGRIVGKNVKVKLSDKIKNNLEVGCCYKASFKLQEKHTYELIDLENSQNQELQFRLLTKDETKDELKVLVFQKDTKGNETPILMTLKANKLGSDLKEEETYITTVDNHFSLLSEPVTLQVFQQQKQEAMQLREKERQEELKHQEETETFSFRVLGINETAHSAQVLLYGKEANDFKISTIMTNDTNVSLKIDQLYQGRIVSNDKGELKLIKLQSQEKQAQSQVSEEKIKTFSFRVLDVDEMAHSAQVLLYGDKANDFKISTIMTNDANASLKIDQLYQGQFTQNEKGVLNLKKAETKNQQNQSQTSIVTYKNSSRC